MTQSIKFEIHVLEGEKPSYQALVTQAFDFVPRVGELVMLGIAGNVSGMYKIDGVIHIPESSDIAGWLLVREDQSMRETVQKAIAEGINRAFQ